VRILKGRKKGLGWRIPGFLLLLVCFAGGFSICGRAEGAAEADGEITLPPAYTELEDFLPPDVAELLPEGLFSENAEEALTAAEELTDWRYLLNALLSAVGLRLSDTVALLCSLVGITLISALLGRLKECAGGGGGELFGFCVRLALYTAMVLQTVGILEVVKAHFAQVNRLMGGMLPVMGILYALGGNPGQAAVNQEVVTVLLALCEYVGATVTPPVCAACTSFALMDALGLRMTLAPLCEQVKRWYASILGIVTFLFSLALSLQTALAGRADSLGMRGIKYAVGNMLPMVGGAVSGALGTVATGVSLLRGICGTSGIVLMVLLLIPTLVQILLLRSTIRLAASIAALLSCDGEARLLGEMASIHGYLAAAVAMGAVTFIIALSLLAHSATAI